MIIIIKISQNQRYKLSICFSSNVFINICRQISIAEQSTPSKCRARFNLCSQLKGKQLSLYILKNMYLFYLNKQQYFSSFPGFMNVQVLFYVKIYVIKRQVAFCSYNNFFFGILCLLLTQFSSFSFQTKHLCDCSTYLE